MSTEDESADLLTFLTDPRLLAYQCCALAAGVGGLLSMTAPPAGLPPMAVAFGGFILSATFGLLAMLRATDLGAEWTTGEVGAD